MLYVPTSVPLVRDSAPLKASPATSGPPLVIAYVSVGSAEPYSLVCASAVTVIGFAVMVRFAGTKVMA